MSRGQVLTFKKTALATNAVISGQGTGEIRKFIAEEGLPSDCLVAVKQLERTTTNGFCVLQLDNKPPNNKAHTPLIYWLVARPENVCPLRKEIEIENASALYEQ